MSSVTPEPQSNWTAPYGWWVMPQSPNPWQRFWAWALLGLKWEGVKERR